MVGVAVQCGRSPSKATTLKGSVKGMEEPSFCNLSLAVDCTLSLGFSTSRTDIPARLSRAGSPDQDLEWSLSVRSEREVLSHHSSEQCEDLSWGGSCNRSDPDLSPDYYPQVPARGAHATDGSQRGFKAWPRSSCKEDLNTSGALFDMSEDHQTYSSRANRQPWLPNYLPSSVANKVDQGLEDGDSFVRVCAHCGTSKTPLWRNGPGGPKSLCNACGIRFKKAGRRTAANGTADSPGSPPVTTKVAKRKLMNDEPQYWVFPADAKPRKRSRGSLPLRTSDSLLSSSFITWQPWSTPKSSFRAPPLSPSEDRKVPALDSGSFSSDEEEGAVLLMALSCGMVHA